MIDEKLKEILISQEAHMKAYLLGIKDHDTLTTADTITRIRQCFLDGGWIHSPLVDYQMNRIKSGELMTGQEWYAAFEREFKKELYGEEIIDAIMCDGCSCDAINAARRASGVKE